MPANLLEATPDRGLRFLEQKLAIYVQGPGQTSRNAALDVLTGRVPDPRLQVLAAAFASQSMGMGMGGRVGLGTSAGIGATGPDGAPDGGDTPEHGKVARPSAVMLPAAAVRMAAVAAARQSQPVASAWLGPKQAGAGSRVRFQRMPRRRPPLIRRLWWAVLEALGL